MRREKGSVIVEFVFVSVMWGVLIAGFLSYARLHLLRLRALSVARLGSTLQATGVVRDEDVNRELKNLISQIKKSDEDWTWTIGRFTDTPASRFYHLVGTAVRIQFGGRAVKEMMVLQKAVP